MSDKKPEFEKAPELFVEKPAEKVTLTEGTPKPAPTVRSVATVLSPGAAARQEPPPSVPRQAPPPVVPRAAFVDPVDKVRAEREAKRQATIKEQEDHAAQMAAIREAGRLEHERDMADDAKAAEAAAEAERAAQAAAVRAAQAEAAAFQRRLQAALAERAERIDREDAEALAKRLKAEEGSDPTIGGQTVLDPAHPLARAARGAAARDMRGNIDAMEAALAAEVEKQPA